MAPKNFVYAYEVNFESGMLRTSSHENEDSNILYPPWINELHGAVCICECNRRSYRQETPLLLRYKKVYHRIH
jgi:hypothetical protein